MAAGAAPERPTVRGAGRARLATVRRDLLLDEHDRLSEQERALISAMLECLIAEIVDELVGAIPASLAPARDGPRKDLIARLKQSGLLDDEMLVGVLLGRAEEERAAQAVRSRPSRRDSRFLQSLVSHDNGPVAAAAMAVVLGRGRRRDPLGQCLVTIDDLEPIVLARAAALVAAALRADLAAAHGNGAADEALAAALAALHRRHERERGIDRLLSELVGLFHATGALDDAMLLAAAGDGEIAFLAHALARRAGIDPLAAQDELLSGDPGRVMALLRMGGASRELAAGLIAGSGAWLGLDDEGEAIDLFDHMPGADVDRARAWLVADPLYRAAVERLKRAGG